MRAGASEDKVRQVAEWRTSELFSTMERDALEYADRITVVGEKVDDELFARIRRHFSEAEVVELTAVVALENFRSRFGPALGIQPQGFCLMGGPRWPPHEPPQGGVARA